uniref:aldehyde oxygenase (deformylating) n=1 Tax=Anthurium amnicola TaxID=1678845 RepID=A0A1D1Y1W7_9ARAE
MALGMPDELLPVFVPPLVYWIAAGIYHMVLGSTDKHRLYTKEEEETQNLATRGQVLAGVLINQATQMALVTLIFMSTGGGKGAAAAGSSTSLLKVVWQLATAVLIMDCWEYWWHRWSHEYKFLFKHVHAMHHYLIVPYAYGAQYIHPVDAFGGEIIGASLATLIPGMGPRAATFFYTILTIKGLDDHCGLWLPNYHPFHRWMTNNSAFHAVHHQYNGFKSNYSGHYLATWDLLLGTYLPYSVQKREGGGYQISIHKDSKTM